MLGRHGNSGEYSVYAKVTEADVLRIREEADAGITHVQLARMYGLTPQSITAIVNGRTWKHLLPEGFVPKHKKRRVPEHDRRRIRRIHQQGLPVSRIALAFEISESTVAKIVKECHCE